MGCTCSSAAIDQVQELDEQLIVKASTSVELPQPVIFALIRNGHEVIRGRLQDIKILLERGELEMATSEWANLRKWYHTHLLLELGTEKGARGFLRLLDKHCDGISTKEDFFAGYESVRLSEEEVSGAFETTDMFQIKAIFYEHKDALFDLLKREDEKLMPCVEGMAERNLDLKQLMKRDVLDGVCNTFGFESFVRYGFGTLEKHDGGMPRVRVYGYALWAVATHKQWEQWEKWIKESILDESFEELNEVIQADKKGKR